MSSVYLLPSPCSATMCPSPPSLATRCTDVSDIEIVLCCIYYYASSASKMHACVSCLACADGDSTSLCLHLDTQLHAQVCNGLCHATRELCHTPQGVVPCSTGVVPCYPSLQLPAMRDARDLHADLKRTASLEQLHQQQVEAEEHQSIAEEPGGGLGASLSSAVKQHLNFGRKDNTGGRVCSA